MRSAVLPLTLAAVALSACASARKPDVALPGAFEARQDLAAGVPAGAIDLDRWWTAYGDTQLTALVEEALARNTDARTAAARLAEARASRSSALIQRVLPRGDLNANGRRTETEQLEGPAVSFPGFSTSGTSETYSADFNVSWELDLFGRFFAARRAANAEVSAARFAYEGARAAVAAQVADAYFQARGLSIQLADARETARIQRELYEVATRRAQTGLAASSEPDRVAGELAQAEAQAASLEAELQAQRRTLLILAGRFAEPTTRVDVPPVVGQIPAVPASVPSQLLARRPDIREAEARISAASGRSDLARLAFFPVFTLTPGVGWQRNEQPGFLSETWSRSIGGAVAQPILDIPRLLAELRAQNARTEQAIIAYERAVQTAFGEAENALVRLDADRRRVALLTDGERRAARAYQAARLGYSRGLTDLQTTLSAEQSWRAARAQLTGAQVQGLRRSVQAYQALGGGWSADQFSTIAKAG
jgi:NodT family efflux transporter outer membrane factor (OMF) lipoprotein